MTNLKLFADSTCDLSLDECRAMDIDMIPISISFKDKTYLDKIDISSKELLEIIKTTGELAQTASPSPLTFYNAFAPYVEKDIPVLCLCLSPSLSSTYANAVIASKNFPEGAVTVIDSQSVCGLIGTMLRICHQLKEQDASVADIISEVKYLSNNYRLYFTLDKLDNLYKSGRLGSTAYIAGSLLGIKPILEMTKDGLKVVKKTRGHAKATDEMIALAKVHKGNIKYPITVASLGSATQHLDGLKKGLTEATGVEVAYECEVGCSLAGHTGDGVYGFGIFLK